MSRPDPEAWLPLTNLSFHVLLALGDGKSHGYAIGKDVETRSHGRLSPATGSLYQALRRLADDGLIEETSGPLGGDARRQYFRLTPFGKRVASLEGARLQELIHAARSKQLMPEA